MTGRDGVRSKFTVVTEETKNGGKLSVDLPGGKVKNDIEVDVTAQGKKDGFTDKIEWNADSVFDGKFDQTVSIGQKNGAKTVHHEAQINVPLSDLQADIEDSLTVGKKGAVSSENRFGFSTPEANGEFVVDINGTVKGKEEKGQFNYEVKSEWNFKPYAKPVPPRFLTLEEFVSVNALNTNLKAILEPVALTADSTSTETEKPTDGSSSSSNNTWIIVGNVGVAVVLSAVGIFFFYRHKSNKEEYSQSGVSTAPYHKMP